MDISDLENTFNSDESLRRLEYIETKLKNQHDRDLQDYEEEHTYKCCSGNSVSKELVKNSIQGGFAFTILLWSLINLSYGSEYHDVSISMLSLISGIMLPSPLQKK